MQELKEIDSTLSFRLGTIANMAYDLFKALKKLYALIIK